MPKYRLKLLDRQEIAEGTMAFLWEKPLAFDYQAGQYAEFTLIDPPDTDAEGDSRLFTLASSPHEDFLMFATRMRDTAFKRVLRYAKKGLAIKIDGPQGDFILHSDFTRPAVFLAGGIGATPFRSIAISATRSELLHKIYFFHANRTPESAPFFKELVDLALKNPNYSYIPTMTEMEHSNRQWGGELGHITADLIRRYINDLSLPIYYIAGPPGMVSSLHRMLKSAGIKDSQIKTENFDGYP